MVETVGELRGEFESVGFLRFPSFGFGEEEPLPLPLLPLPLLPHVAVETDFL